MRTWISALSNGGFSRLMIRFSATPASYRLPPPSLDQHGEEIRRWLARPEPGPEAEA